MEAHQPFSLGPWKKEKEDLPSLGKGVQAELAPLTLAEMVNLRKMKERLTQAELQGGSQGQGFPGL